MTTITEADVEQAALDWLSSLGWRVGHGQRTTGYNGAWTAEVI